MTRRGYRAAVTLAAAAASLGVLAAAMFLPELAIEQSFDGSFVGIQVVSVTDEVSEAVSLAGSINVMADDTGSLVVNQSAVAVDVGDGEVVYSITEDKSVAVVTTSSDIFRQDYAIGDQAVSVQLYSPEEAVDSVIISDAAILEEAALLSSCGVLPEDEYTVDSAVLYRYISTSAPYTTVQVVEVGCTGAYGRLDMSIDEATGKVCSFEYCAADDGDASQTAAQSESLLVEVQAAPIGSSALCTGWEEYLGFSAGERQETAGDFGYYGAISGTLDGEPVSFEYGYLYEDGVLYMRASAQ